MRRVNIDDNLIKSISFLPFMILTKELIQFMESLPFSFTLWERKGGDKFYSLYRSKASEKLLGIKKEDFFGKEYFECYPHAPLTYRGRFMRVLDKEEIWRVEEFRYIGPKKKGLFRFTSFKVDENVVGVIIEPSKQCTKTNNDGTPCPNMAVLGNFCMKHALQQLGKKAL